VSRLAVPLLGLGFGLRHLIRSGHPGLAVVILVVVVVALVLAARNGRRR
jgi:hypothetical protein